MGFPQGLRGETALLNVLWHAGLRYICTQALGKHGPYRPRWLIRITMMRKILFTQSLRYPPMAGMTMS